MPGHASCQQQQRQQDDQLASQLSRLTLSLTHTRTHYPGQRILWQDSSGDKNNEQPTGSNNINNASDNNDNEKQPTTNNEQRWERQTVNSKIIYYSDTCNYHEP